MNPIADLLARVNELQTSITKPPIAAVVRADIYEKLKTHGAFQFKDAPLDFSGGLRVVPDPAVNSIAMAQTDECLLFYDDHALTLYLNRGNDPLAWIQYCCEQAGIPCPINE